MKTRAATVLVTGTFDVLHGGHIAHFKQAKRYGKRLVVLVARDETVKRLKGQRPYFNGQQRCALLRELKIVDVVVLGDLKDPLRVIKRLKPDVICLGHDQKIFVDLLEGCKGRLPFYVRVLRSKPVLRGVYRSKNIKHHYAVDKRKSGGI